MNYYKTTRRHAPEDSGLHRNYVFGPTKGGKFLEQLMIIQLLKIELASYSKLGNRSNNSGSYFTLIVMSLSTCFQGFNLELLIQKY